MQLICEVTDNFKYIRVVNAMSAFYIYHVFMLYTFTKNVSSNRSNTEVSLTKDLLDAESS